MAQNVTVKSIAANFGVLPVLGAPAFPEGWKETPQGAFTLQVMTARGWAAWEQVPKPDRNRLRHLFHSLVSGSIAVDFDKLTKETSDLLKGALIGDAVQRLHIRILMVLKKLEGPAKMDFETKYSSGKHHAEYWCRLNKLPLPTTKGGLKACSDNFEYAYVSPAYQKVYLETEFGVELAAIAISSAKQCLV